MSVTSESIDYLFKKGDVLIKQCNCSKCKQVIETYWEYVGRSGARKEFKRIGCKPYTKNDRPLCTLCEPTFGAGGKAWRDENGRIRNIGITPPTDESGPWQDHAIRCREEGAM